MGEGKERSHVIEFFFLPPFKGGGVGGGGAPSGARIDGQKFGALLLALGREPEIHGTTIGPIQSHGARRGQGAHLPVDFG